MFKSGGISTIFFSAMFGETAKWTGIFSTVVEKNEWLNHWKNTELEGEGNSSVNYLDASISIRWTLYDK